MKSLLLVPLILLTNNLYSQSNNNDHKVIRAYPALIEKTDKNTHESLIPEEVQSKAIKVVAREFYKMT